MSRNHGPDEFLDQRDISAEAIRDPRQSATPEPSREQGQGSDPQEDGRLTPNRAPAPTQPRSAEPREIFEVRGKTYRLRSSEIQTLSELGKFRAVATKDLEEFAYQGDKDLARADVQNLIRHGLIAEKKIPNPETSPRRLLTLSKQGHQFLKVTERIPRIRPSITALPSPVKPTTMRTCTGCITRQPIGSSARAGGISA